MIINSKITKLSLVMYVYNERKKYIKCYFKKVLIICLTVASFTYTAEYKNKIEFERTKIIDAEDYWASSKDKNKDYYHEKYPFPVSLNEPWPGQLDVVEYRFKGCAPSRFEPDKYLGNSEYVNTIFSITWTEDFGPYYVAKFNVKPSKQFYDYVMSFPGSWTSWTKNYIKNQFPCFLV